MCCNNKKLVLLKECVLKYYDMAGNILLYQTLTQDNQTNKSYPTWVYIVAWCAIISSFARLMLRFRRLDIQTISCLTSPMIPCEMCLCNKEEFVNNQDENKIRYKPAYKRIFLCGFWLSFLWLWYAILIYPFITLSVIISTIYYDIDDIEFNKLLLLYKNHNLIAFVVEDIPILAVLIKIYTIDEQDLFVLIWVCLSTSFKLITIFRRIYTRKLLFNINELNDKILYNKANSNSSGAQEEAYNLSLDLELQIQNDTMVEIGISEKIEYL